MKTLTAEVKQELLAPFQAAEIRVRTSPYVAAYVTARVVMTRLDEVLPWQWSFKLTGPGVVDANGVMHQDGVLIFYGDDRTEVEYHDRGSAPPDVARVRSGDTRIGQAKQAKHAVSDCFKRCAVHAGVARYLYEIQGVQGGRIPKPSLEKALAAIGYRGPWDDRHHGPIGGMREADMEDEPGSPADHAASPAASSGRATRESVKIDAAGRDRIVGAVEKGGGSAGASSFLSWLAANTANHAKTLDDVLAEDLDELVRKLDDLAAKRKA